MTYRPTDQPTNQPTNGQEGSWEVTLQKTDFNVINYVFCIIFSLAQKASLLTITSITDGRMYGLTDGQSNL